MRILRTNTSNIINADGLNKLIREPKTVIVRGGFNEGLVKSFEKDFDEALETGQSIVPVIVDSYGGEAYSLLPMLDIIAASPVPVATIVAGKAMSCGSFLAAAGTFGYRYITPNSTFLIHEAESMAWGKEADLKVSADHLVQLNERVFALLDTFCKQPSGYWKRRIHDNEHADIYVDAQQAIACGLADKIGMPSWKIDFTATVAFVK